MSSLCNLRFYMTSSITITHLFYMIYTITSYVYLVQILPIKSNLNTTNYRNIDVTYSIVATIIVTTNVHCV